MCTAVTYQTDHFYFGRNLDYYRCFGEEVLLTPRGFPLSFRKLPALPRHHAMIGMALAGQDYPLYYEGMNEHGLCIAGLNFVGNACYREEAPDRDNVAQFELIPWILGQCSGLEAAVALLERINLWNVPYQEGMPLAQLHWLVADRTGCVTVEAVADGVHIYDNSLGVLTNNPPFPVQMYGLNSFMSLSSRPPENNFCLSLALHADSCGMGAIGLPGDLSSQSRFVRAAFTRMNSQSGRGEEESVSQLFHILGSVEQTRGCCQTEEGQYEITLYSCCCSAERGIYYYTTYDNHQITAIDMHREDLERKDLIHFPLVQGAHILRQN